MLAKCSGLALNLGRPEPAAGLFVAQFRAELGGFPICIMFDAVSHCHHNLHMAVSRKLTWRGS